MKIMKMIAQKIPFAKMLIPLIPASLLLMKIDMSRINNVSEVQKPVNMQLKYG
jgi:hypothetical protein